MSYSALDNPYVLDDEGADDLLVLETQPSPPVSSPGFVSRAADAKRLAELNAFLIGGRRD
jgi:hypothetical protein